MLLFIKKFLSVFLKILFLNLFLKVEFFYCFMWSIFNCFRNKSFCFKYLVIVILIGLKWRCIFFIFFFNLFLLLVERWEISCFIVSFGEREWWKLYEIWVLMCKLFKYFLGKRNLYVIEILRILKFWFFSFFKSKLKKWFWFLGKLSDVLYFIYIWLLLG